MLGERHNQARPYEQAFNEDRTRDLALTKRMLCQLSYRGERLAGSAAQGGAEPSAIVPTTRFLRCVYSTRVVFNPSKVKIRVRVPMDAHGGLLYMVAYNLRKVENRDRYPDPPSAAIV